MPKLHYRVVMHDGGWAYTLDGVFSEPFASRDLALRAAREVAAEQHVAGETTQIEYQDTEGAWHSYMSDGSDRPDTDVVIEQD